MTEQDNVELKFLQREVERLKAQSRTPADSLQTGSVGGNPPHIPDMNERLAKLEGAFRGVEHTQTMLLGGIGLVAAIVLALGVFTLTKLDQQGDRIDKLTERTIEIPSKIAAELRDLTKTLADSITAAKQTPPQVILMPAPQLPPTPPQQIPTPRP